jgi:hypothetical protein
LLGEDASSESLEFRAAEHLPLDHFDPVDLAFCGAGAVGQGEAVATAS